MRLDKEYNMHEKRDHIIDIIKFIAIFSVVIGHAFNTDVFYGEVENTVRKFLYIYHLPVFFWCSGYLYKKKDFKLVLKGIIKQRYLKTTLFCIGSFFLIPFFDYLGIIKEISISNLFFRIIKVLIYYPTGGILTNSLWFMTFFTEAMLLFELLIRLIKHDKNRIFIASMLGGIGLLLVNYVGLGIYYVNLVLLLQPIILFGYYTKKFKLKYYEKIGKVDWIVAIAVILLINHVSGLEIEFSKALTYGCWFYFMSFIGLIFCISLAKKLLDFQNKKMMIYIGQHTFEIMALHCMVFKIFDGILFKIMGEPTGIDLTLYPISFSEIGMRFSYILVGMIIPLLVCKGMDWINEKYQMSYIINE